MPPFPFVVLDTEATGLFPRIDKILELAIVRFEEGEKVAEYSSLYRVDREIPSHIQALTHIRPADLEGKPLLSEEKGKIEELLKGALIIGHNIPYDLGMLTGEGFTLESAPWVDSAMLASILFPELESWSLAYMSTVLGLPHEPKHRALGDVHATLALFEKEWERLSELPEKTLKDLQALGEKGPEGYATLLSAVEAMGKKKPTWLKKERKRRGVEFMASGVEPRNAPTDLTLEPEALTAPGEGAVTLLTAPLNSSFFCQYMKNIPKETRVWGAVKNIEAALRALPEEALEETSVLFPPTLLLDPEAAKRFLAQETFSPYELTLALKVTLFTPSLQVDLPIHSDERDVWKGKLGCTKDSPAYVQQFKTLKQKVLIDHYHLLELLAAGGGPETGERVIVDDASMLEDTATKAFRWNCPVDVLRAGAEGGSESLTRFLDLYQLWVERVRNDLSIRYLVEADLRTPEVKGVRERLEEVLKDPSSLTPQIQERLLDLQKILIPENLEARLAWIEQFRDGGQILQSVPFDIASFLWEVLYDKCPTTLLLPPGNEESFRAIVPLHIDVETVSALQKNVETPHLLFTDPKLSLDRLITHLDGKVIALLGSKRTIEQLFITHADALEKKGVTLVAQGMSGGQGRMQAEFLAAEGSALWLLTPWMYEGVELPEGTVDHLFLASLPFDHPSHAVLSRRSERFKNAFEDYMLPRLYHRLFRILRTYMLHRKEDGDVLVLDERIRTKEYGKGVRAYLEHLVQ